jgi:coproporphyrinogen dehydrogenase HemZ
MNNCPWGRITGVRPVKIIKNMLQSGLDAGQSKEKFLEDYMVSEEKARLCLEIAEREIKLLEDIDENDICLYVGIPFCKSRCLYCSFVTAQSAEDHSLIPHFMKALKAEITAAGRLAGQHNFRIVCVYIGGGTPTVLSAEDLSKVIGYCRDSFDLSKIREFTVEAGRADTIDNEKLSALKEAGVTRISINPQSMRQETLTAIGRQHTPAEVEDAFYQARKTGFGNINMDVIAGLPFETGENFADTLRQVDALNPESITVHTMCIKKGSRLHERLGEYALTDAETAKRMVDFAYGFMKQTKRHPYYLYRLKYAAGSLENIGYSKEGFECLYNILMMQDISTVISVGGGGVTKVVGPDKISRVFNVKEPREYINRIDEMIERKKVIFI